ncbi:MAG: Protein-disulfide reductase [Moraxellaceae bacterium]|jgi:thiol:disulfide interchange protein DsbD|nr:Protein-disulfide reductase [Moraxellaceae bacterium]
MLRVLSLLVLLALHSAGFGEVPDFSGISAGDAEVLPVEQAFHLESRADGANRLALEWTIAPGYALYRDRIQAGVETPAGVRVSPPAFSSTAVLKDDPSFGRVAVFHDTAKAVLALAEVPAAQAGQPVTVWLRYQGCADEGVCYPPQTVKLEIAQTVAVRGGPVAPTSVAVAAPKAAGTVGVGLPSAERGLEDAGGIAGFLGQSSLPLILLTFFALGLGLTFTPCVFPMMPILSGLIAGEDSSTMTTARAFRLSLAYVLGMASTYALVGTLVGYFGARANVQLWLQTPAVLVGFALVFVLLALSMFGFYELQLPSFLRDRLDHLSRRQKGGRLLGVFVMGVLSALVVSPCVSAPLAGTLVYISTTGDAVLGGLALLALGLGMGTPLVLIGTSGGKLLPRAGNWMLAVKAVFGTGLLAVAIWLVARVIPGAATLVLWAALFGIAGVYLGALEAAAFGWARLWKGLGILFLLYAGFLFAGAMTGQDDPLHPLGAFAHAAVAPGETRPQQVEFQRVTTETELRAALAEARKAGRGAVVDFYADWCAACQVMERTTFRDPAVRAALEPRLRLQLDLSENTPEQRRLLQLFHLYGPPAMLFFDAQGEEEAELRVQSEISAKHLRARLGA